MTSSSIWAEVTEISGTISTATTMSDTIMITDDVTIANGVTVHIQPGSYIIAANTARVFVEGTLSAIGTETDSIKFTAEGMDLFGGIYFIETNSTNDSSFFNYCKFSNSGYLGGYTDLINVEGGAMHIDGFSKIAITNSTFANNNLTNSGRTIKGGALFIHNASPVIENTLFYKNWAIAKNSSSSFPSSYGGALYMVNCKTSFVSCVFQYNKISSTYEGAYGGAIYCDSSAINFSGCLIQGNRFDIKTYSDSPAGCGLAIVNSTVDFTDTKIIDNMLVAQSHNPSRDIALSSANSSLSFNRCHVTNNYQPQQLSSNTITFNCTTTDKDFYFNATNSVFDADLKFNIRANTTFKTTIKNSTFINDFNITNYETSTLEVDAANSIFELFTYHLFDSNDITVTNCIIERPLDALPQTGFTEADPLYINEEQLDYRLSASSPAVDAGETDPLVGSLDCVSNSRVLGTSVDIGAFEFDESYSAPAKRNQKVTVTKNTRDNNIILSAATPNVTYRFINYISVARDINAPYYKHFGNEVSFTPPTDYVGTATIIYNALGYNGILYEYDTLTITVTEDEGVSSTSLDPVNSGVDVTVYPNPVVDYVTVFTEDEDAQVFIYNRKEKIVGVGRSVSMKSLPSGIYYVVIKSEGQIESVTPFYKK